MAIQNNSNDYLASVPQQATGLTAAFQQRAELTARRERMLAPNGQPTHRPAPEFLKKRAQSAPLNLNKSRA